MKIFNSVVVALVLLFTSFSIVSCDKTKAEYEKSITEADGFFNDSKYDEAMKSYSAAANLKPEEEYPKEKISAINVIIAQNEEAAGIEAEIKAEENYLMEIEEGDYRFDNGEYEEAIASYIRALSYKPAEAYPVDKVNEIELLMEEAEEMASSANNRFHIVVGSFEIESNAEDFQQKLKDQGYNARLVSRSDGVYTAVTIASYPTLNGAYNGLSEARDKMGHAWVIYKRFN